MLARAQRNVAHVARDRAQAEAPGPKPGGPQISGDFQTRPLLEGLPRRDYRRWSTAAADLSCAVGEPKPLTSSLNHSALTALNCFHSAGTSSS